MNAVLQACVAWVTSHILRLLDGLVAPVFPYCIPILLVHQELQNFESTRKISSTLGVRALRLKFC